MRGKAIFMALLALAFGAQGASVSVSLEQAKRTVGVCVRNGEMLGLRGSRLVDEAKSRTISLGVTEVGEGLSVHEVALVGGGRVYVSDVPTGNPIVAITDRPVSLDVGDPLYDLLKGDAALRHAQSSVAVGASIPVKEATAQYQLTDIRVAPLLATRWGQGGVPDPNAATNVPCYNFCTPTNYPCGCSATAAAQIMRYFRYPEVLSAADEFECLVDGEKAKLKPLTDEEGNPVPYAWDLMEDRPTGASSEESRQAIGHLTYDIAAALGSSFTELVTSSSPAALGRLYTDVFGYANASLYWDTANISTGRNALHDRPTRERILYANLDAGRPVHLCIYGYLKDQDDEIDTLFGQVAHAVVADGYGFMYYNSEDTAYVHINFGQEGAYDAWYNIPEIDIGENLAVYPYLGAAVFNITTNAEEVGQQILSGRLTDTYGRPMTNALVRIFSADGVDLTVRPNTNGIYVAFVPSNTTYDVRADSTIDGRIGWAKTPIVVGATVTDERGFVTSAASVGNYWGADLVMDYPSVGVGNRFYPDLSRALREAGDGAVVEILRPTWLVADFDLTNDLTIVATNANPRLSPIMRFDGAELRVKGGTTCLTNVAFELEGTTPVRVFKPGVVRVAGTVVCDDIVNGVPGITTDDPSCFVLAGPLENGLTLECSGTSQNGAPFGSYACDDATAAASALRIVSVYGVDRAGAVGEGNALVWRDNSPVDQLVGVASVGGEPPVYYRTLDRLFEDHPAGADVVLRMSGAKLSQPLALADGSSSISAAEGLGEAVIYPQPTAGFTLGEGCDLTVSGVTFEGYKGSGLFVLNDATASICLTNVVFRDIEGAGKHSGALAIKKGRATVIDSVFDNCRANGVSVSVNPITHFEKTTTVNSYGGAVYLEGEDCVLDLDGGAIENCSAANYGGGICAKNGSTVRVQGGLSVRGNSSSNPTADDIYLQDGADLVLAGPIDGQYETIGVRYGSGLGNGEGEAFAAIDDGLSAEEKVAAARAFFNDTDPEGLQAAVSDDGTALVWAERTRDNNQLDPLDPAVAVRVIKTVDGQTVTGCYARAEYAFAWIDAAATVIVDKSVDFDEDLTVDHPVVLTAPNASNVLRRRSDAVIRVSGLGSLTVTNVALSGSNVSSTMGLVYVDGGTLTLQQGSQIRNVLCSKKSGQRAGGAVTVWNRGEFTMEDGAQIANCTNEYSDPGSKAGYGAGVLIDNATAFFRGGSVNGCHSCRGAGVFVGNGSEVYVSGNVTVTGNRDLHDQADNFCVSDDSRLYLTGDAALAGTIGFNEGKSADTNVFGRVAAGFTGTAEDAQASAHRFTHDRTGDVGFAVSDGVETLLVWSRALNAEGNYVAEDGTVYAQVAFVPCRVGKPSAVVGLVYDGTEKVGVKGGLGYVLADNVATNAGDYTAMATLKGGFVWSDDTVDPFEIPWSIAPADYVLTGVTFEDATFPYDGTVKTIVLTGTLPDGLNVTYANNERWEPGTNDVVATISGTVANHKPFSTTLSAKLIITGVIPPADHPDYPAEPGGRIVDPTPIAFQAIERLSATEWKLTVTNAVRSCWYSLRGATTLAPASFEQIGEKRQAAENGPIVFEVTVPETDAQWFWNAVGEPGESLD